jgi:hypothetical protein
LDVNALVAFLIQNGRKWIIDQCEFHHPHSVPLAGREIEILKMFYREATIERTRIRHVPRIENPPFYTELARVGISIPLDFSQMAGITFVDTILISDLYAHAQPRISLLFHEMVHVVQYGWLGVAEFTSQYVQGWAQNEFVYAAIPLEREAYDLQERFDSAPQDTFSVEEIVIKKWGIN